MTCLRSRGTRARVRSVLRGWRAATEPDCRRRRCASATRSTRNPIAPCASDCASSAFMRSSSAGVAFSPTARSPITTRRIALWPAMKPALTPSVAVELAEVLAERLPVPRHPLCETVGGHALHPRQHVQQIRRRLLRQRRDAEPAVAAEDGRDAVVARRAERAVPEHLRVVVRVHVDEAGRYDVPRCIDRLTRSFADAADGGDAAILDAEVADEARDCPNRR